MTLADSLRGRIDRELRSTDAPEVGTGPKDLLDFTCRTFPGYRPAAVHVLLAAKLEEFLEKVEARLSPRLVISLPPRHGKSEISSVRFPAYVLGNRPDWPIIHVSYTSD